MTTDALTNQGRQGDASPSPSPSTPWTLGFVEPAPAASLLRHRFRSKLGGRPAWLDPVALPGPDELTCRATGAPLDFLLQLYAPLDAPASAFHRALYVFVSPDGGRLAEPGAVRAWRCQLPRANAFYADVPAGPADAPRPATPAVPDRWGVAAAEAAVAAGLDPGPRPDGGRLFPEAELVVDDDPADRDDDDDGACSVASDADARRVMAKMKVAAAAVPGGGAGVMTMGDSEADDDSDADADDAAATADLMDRLEADLHPDAAAMADFAALVAPAPDQVLRYRRGATDARAAGDDDDDAAARPLLWPRASPRPPPPPPCPACGGPRVFEVQLLPQLLNFLGADAAAASAPDFAAAAVYTCAASCGEGAGGGYREEWVWVQPGD